MKRIAPEIRFWAKVRQGEGCWEWQGSRLPHGYGGFAWSPPGVIRINGYAHRFSWEIHFGPIPEGMRVCHHCDNPPCVRPDHLFLGTAQHNTQDMVRKGRVTRYNSQKTHCKQGHEFTPENTLWTIRPGTERKRRHCKACMAAATRRHRQRSAA